MGKAIVQVKINGNTTLVRDRPHLLSLIESLDKEQLADDLWETSKHSFQVGKKIGNRLAWEEANRRYGVRNPYDPKLGGSV